MLCVKTKVLSSPIHGLGLFADEFISKGTVLWRFTPGFDLKFTAEEILQLPPPAQIYLCTYAWKSMKHHLYYFCSDNTKYMNHSENPHCLSFDTENGEESFTLVIRDIQKGEELTENYHSFVDYEDKENVLWQLASIHNVDVSY